VCWDPSDSIGRRHWTRELSLSINSVAGDVVIPPRDGCIYSDDVRQVTLVVPDMAVQTPISHTLTIDVVHSDHSEYPDPRRFTNDRSVVVERRVHNHLIVVIFGVTADLPVFVPIADVVRSGTTHCCA